MLITTSQPQSGSYVTFAFDKEALKLINKVASDPIYSIEANWKLVTLVFKQQNGNKKFTSAFRDFVNPKNSKLRSGMMSGDVMELQKIIISKTNRQHLVIYRNEITGASGFDFTLSNSFSAPVGGTAYRYYKVINPYGFSTSGNTALGMADLQFNYDGSDHTATVLSSNVSWAGYIPLSRLSDGNTTETNYVYYNGQNVELVFDLGISKSVSSIHVWAQGNGNYNMPTKLVVYGSNDNSTFNLIKSIDPIDWGYSDGQGLAGLNKVLSLT